MATIWMGGHPNQPDYYIYVRYVEIDNSFFNTLFTGKKTYTKKIVSIITSSEYYSLNKDARKFYKGMTIQDVKEHGTEEFKKQLPRAEAQALAKAIGFPI